MADDLLKELLTSPLEEPVKRSRRKAGSDDEPGIHAEGTGDRGTEQAPRPGLPTTPLLAAAGAVLGAVIVLIAYSVGSEDPPTTTVPPTTTTTIAATATGEPAGLPADYTPIGDRIGMRVERILIRADGVFLTVTTVVENSLDPDESAGFRGGVWTLVLADDRRITSTEESFDPLARGTVSVRFPPDGIVAEDIVGLEVNGIANRLTTVVDAELPEGVTLPDDGSPVDLIAEPLRFGIDADLDLVVDTLNLSTDSGLMSWQLDGGATSAAAVVPILTLEGDDETIEMSTRVQTSGFTFFHPSVATAPLTDSGENAFDPPTPEALTTGPWTASLALQVTWAVYDSVVVTLPVEGVAVAVVGR